MATASATADPAAPAGADAAPAKPRNGVKKLAIMLLVLIAVGGGGAAYWWQSQAAAVKPEADPKNPAPAAETPKAEAIYLPLVPSLVVNLSDDEAMRYLQVDLEVTARDPATIEAVKNHMPLVRNNLLLLLGAQRYFDLDTREEKEHLQKRVLDEVRQTLRSQKQSDRVEAVYFTSFIMQ